MSVSLKFASLYDDQVFMWSDCPLDPATDFLVVTWSLFEMLSILRQHLIPVACILLCSSSVRVHDSQAYRKMDLTRERVSRIFEL